MSSFVKLVGKPAIGPVENVRDKIGQDFPGLQALIDDERATCPNSPDCDLMPYVVRNLEEGTAAPGGFCINRCSRLAEVVERLSAT
jgi:hypothetical protein